MVVVMPALSVSVPALACLLGWRAWYSKQPGVRSYLVFKPCRLLKKETLVEAEGNRYPVRRLTFALPDGAQDDSWLDLGIGQHVKMQGSGFKSRSYSPVALRPGEFDLIVKVYPPSKAGVSSHLDSLELGDDAYVSGPYPPWPFKHITRNPGKRLGIIAFGVGITEAITVARGELERGDAEVVSLLWALRDRSDYVDCEELSSLSALSGNRSQGAAFELHTYFSRERGERLGPRHLREFFPWLEGGAELRFLAVGTKEMMRTAYRWLDQLGVPYQPLLRKGFGPGRSSASTAPVGYVPVPEASKL